MKYQKGTVYPSGKRVKMWYGKYLVYQKDRQGKEVCKHRCIKICAKANTPKWKAEQMLKEIILKETKGVGPTPTLPSDDSVTFRWFVRERYIPMRRGSWSPAYRKTNTYNLEHYLIEHFGDLPLRNLSTFEIQVWLNNLAGEKDYSQSVVGSCFSNIRAITHLARKQKFLAEDPGEDVTMPLTKLAEKPVMSLEQSLSLLGAITDLHDLCLMLVGIFSGPRASEAMGLQWKSWTGESLMPHGTAFEGKLYKGRLKSKASRAPIPVPVPVRPVIEAWRKLCPDPSPEALMFPTFGRGERKGEAVPREAKNFLTWRIRPVSRKLGIPDHLVTFQVMRRSLGTHLQQHGTLKDTQGVLRHASITTTGNVYVQVVEESVMRAVNSHATAVLDGWTPTVEGLGLKGRNLKRSSSGGRTPEGNSVKFGEVSGEEAYM
jgi:integrase